MQWLRDNMYLSNDCLTQLAHDELAGHIDLTVVKVEPMAVVPFVTPENWPSSFMEFIAEAKVPRMLEGKHGEMYHGNKYSEAGMKAYRKALEKEGVQYDVLVKSTMLYYKSSIRLKKAVGNYFALGDWRTDYDALMHAAESGEQTLTKHIKDETSAGFNGGYVIG